MTSRDGMSCIFLFLFFSNWGIVYCFVLDWLTYIGCRPTFYRICKKKDVQEFQPYPYVATVLNCLFWIFYGLPIVKPDSILVVTINSVGLVLELIYLGIFCFFDKQNKGRKKVSLGLLGEVIFMAAIVATTLLAFHTHEKRILFVGVFCDIFNILMYASPLTIVKTVVTTKSVEFMPLYLSLANFLNGCVWTAYALIKFDIFMLVSNGLGAFFGLIQLVLYAFYYKSTPKHGSTEVKPSEIQLPASDTAFRV
ncbi:hypothetical protein SADUNF_Sadunf16G0220800 [Salix dunnii]|uniref:Bidirectional sugar transporter SWEET n=1 Tax=Salix dunnii TaxID=1413687 RepID=A0A835JD26_9ROSI|nr:hypothetical protein SADUNF_Sadunf16G0220800 [Salix dunnii]